MIVLYLNVLGAIEMAIKNCTPESPMPPTRDWVGHVWYHHGVEVVSKRKDFLSGGLKAHYRCPNCGVEFWAPFTPQEVESL